MRTLWVTVVLLSGTGSFAGDLPSVEPCGYHVPNNEIVFTLEVIVALTRSHTTFTLCPRRHAVPGFLLVDRVNPEQTARILLDDTSYVNLLDRFQRALAARTNDRSTFADGSNWCVGTVSGMESCFATPEARTQQRGLEAVTELGAELTRISGVKNATLLDQ